MNKLFLLFGTLLLLGCAEVDPGNAVSHIHVGKYIFDLTFGPLFTVLCTGLLAPIIVNLIGRKIRKSDEHKMAAIARIESDRKEEADKIATMRREAARIKEDLELERHKAVIGKIDGMCKRFDKVDERFHDHEHIVEIDGKVYRSNGKITI